jgi:hypothetical protein
MKIRRINVWDFTALNSVINFLWKRLAVKSHRSQKKIESELRKKLLKERSYRYFSDYDVFYGTVADGKFSIYRKMDFRRGYVLTLRGEIEAKGRGSVVTGRFFGAEIGFLGFVCLGHVMDFFNLFKRSPHFWLIDGFLVAMFVFWRYMEGQSRKKFFELIHDICD